MAVKDPLGILQKAPAQNAASDPLGILKKKDGTPNSANGTAATSPSVSLSKSTYADDDFSDVLGTALAKTNTDASQRPIPISNVKLGAHRPLLTAQQKLENQAKQIVAKQVELPQSVIDYNVKFGTAYNPQEILDSPDKSAEFLQQMKEGKVVDMKHQYEAQKAQAESLAEHPHNNYDFKIENPVDPNSFQNKSLQHIKDLQEHVVQSTVDEQKQNNLPDKVVINKLFQRLDPKGYDTYVKNIEERTGQKYDATTEDNLWQGATNDFDVARTVKAPFELALNQAKRKLADDRMVIGTTTGNQSLIDDAKALQATTKSEDQIYSEYPTLNKSRVATYISQELAAAAGQLKGTEADNLAGVIDKVGYDRLAPEGMLSQPMKIASTAAFQKYASDPLTRDAAMAVLADPSSLPDYSFLGSITSNFVKPAKDLFMSLGDIAGVRDGLDRSNAEVKAGLFKEELPNLKDYVHNVRTIANTTALLGGYAALGTVGGEIGAGAKLAPESFGAKALHSGLSFGIGSYDANRTDADKFIKNDAAKVAYATIGMAINTVGGELLELPLLSKIPALQKPLLEMANKIGDGTITKTAMKELLSKAKDPYIEAVEKYGINVAKNTAVMKYFSFANGMNKFAFGGQDLNDVVDETTSGLVDTALGVSILAGIGAHNDIQNGKNSTIKSTLYKLAANHDAARDIITRGLKDGTYTPEQYNQKIQILNTAIKAKNDIDLIQKDKGITLETPQKAVYVTNRVAEGVIAKKMENPLISPSEKTAYEAQLVKLQNQRDDILKGLKFDDNHSPLINVYNAENEFLKQKENFNNDVPGSEEKMIQAKEAFIQAQKEARQGITNTVKEQPVTETVKLPVRNDDFIEKHFTDKDKEDYAALTTGEEKSAFIEEKRQAASKPIDKVEETAVRTERDDLLDKAKELVNTDGVVKGFTAPFLKDAANTKPSDFESHLKDISEQANDPLSNAATIKTYGKDLVDIAQKLNPVEEKRPIVEEKKQEKESEKILPEDNFSVGDMIDKTGTYKGKKGSFIQDGQTVVFKTEGGNKEYEIGNIEEVKDKPINDFDITHEESLVKVNDKGNFDVRGNEYVNNHSDPLQAITRDKDGNIVNVRLETSDGRKRTFKGNTAEDLAYQIHLKEINKNNETKDKFEKFINEDESVSKQINDETVSETTKTEPAKNNAEVPREKIKAVIDAAITKPTDVVVDEGVDNLKNVESTTKAIDGLGEGGLKNLQGKVGNFDSKTIAEKYHLYKGLGTNPELVKSVEDAISPKKDLSLQSQNNDNAELTKLLPDTLSPTEKQGSLAGGEANAEATVITGAIHRAVEETGTGGKKLSPDQVRQKEEAELKKYAKDKGILIDNNFGEPDHFGNEQDVYVDKDGTTVTKINDNPTHDTWNDFFHKIAIHNSLFPDVAYTLKGFSERDGHFAAVLEQPLITKGNEAVKFSEVKDELGKMGFEPSNDPKDFSSSEDYRNKQSSNVFENKKTGVKVSDLHGENVIKGTDSKIHFIDPLITLSQDRKSGKITPNETTSENKIPDTPKKESVAEEVVNKPIGEAGKGKEPEEVTAESNIDNDDPLEVSLQRKELIQDIQDAFYKPTDGSKSIKDDTVLNNAVNTVTREAKSQNKSIRQYLDGKVQDWYNSVFGKDGNRLKDRNGRDRQLVLTDEQQAIFGMQRLQLAKQIREAKYDPASVIDSAVMDNLDNQQLQSDNLAAIIGESSGRALRFLGSIYKFGNNAEYELVKKQAARVLGVDIPLDQKEFDKFSRGLTPSQKRSAEIVRNAVLKYKATVDAANEAWDRSEAMTSEQYKAEVQKQVKLAVDKAIAESKKEWESESKNAAKEGKVSDSKGRIVKNKADDIANKINDFADKLGGKGLAMSSPLGLVQITAKWVLKGIAEGIRQGGKIPELIERYTREAKDKKEFEGYDEAKLLEQVHGALSEAGIDKKTFEAKLESDTSIKAIKEFAKNSNTKFITKEAISKGLVKKLFHSLGEQGIPIDKIADVAVSKLDEAGIETNAADINAAYLGRGKYRLETKEQIETESQKIKNEIIQHQKLQADIADIDRKIKEVNETGQLSLSKRDEKLSSLEEEKRKKIDEFESVLRSKGIKLERGSLYSREHKEAVIDSNNEAVKSLGEKVTNYLNDNSFGDISEATKNFLRGLSDKLSHTINAHNLDTQLNDVKNAFENSLIDFNHDHLTGDQFSNTKLNEIYDDIQKMANNLEKNKDVALENIKLNDYKKRLESEKKEFERKKAAGEWDNTKNVVDLKKDDEAYHLQIEKDKAKYEFYRAQKAALEANDTPLVKGLKGASELSRNLLLSGLTGIQIKLGLAAATRQLQFTSRSIGRLAGKALGIESLRFRPKNAAEEWRVIKDTLLTKTASEGKSIIEQSNKVFDEKLAQKNAAEETYKQLVIDKGIYSKDATQYQINELAKAKTEYDVAALEQAFNEQYQHITPLDKGGRWSIFSQGITKEEQEAGLLGKRETLNDYLKTDFEKISEDEAAAEVKKGINALPDSLKRKVKQAIFYSKWIVRSHGVYKDIPARHELLSGYLNRLKDAQEKGIDISDPNVKSKAWFTSVLYDMQEAKFQDKNSYVNMVRSAQKSLAGDKWLESKRGKEILDVVVKATTPVLKVPANIFHTALEYNFGALIGTVKVLDAYYKAANLDMPLKEFAETRMTDEQKYRIQTALGRGSLGLATMIAAYYATQNGLMITGGAYPEPKKKGVKLSDGTTVDLEYGDIVINGHMIPHLIAKGLAHLPQFFPAMFGNDIASSNIYETGKGNPHAVIDGFLDVGQKLITEIPGLPIERKSDGFFGTSIGFKNPFSYIGYFGAVKDIEALLGAEKKAPDYMLTTKEKYYNNAGLIFMVPTKQEAAQRMKDEKREMKGSANDAKKRFKEYFKKK